MEQNDKNLLELLNILINSIQDPRQEIVARICLRNLIKESKQEETIEHPINRVNKITPISELNLPNRIELRLRRGEIYTIEQLREANFNQLIRISGVGAKTITDIYKVLTERFKH